MNHAERQRACEQNRRAWDQLVLQKNRFTRPARDKDLVAPLKTVDGPGWLGASIEGKQLLCLAAGGGKHGVIYAAAGAVVTVVDLSPAMLELDREVAAELGYDIRTVETSMDDLGMFDIAQFDIVIHPVSTCYLPSLLPVYRHVARVTRPGGVYVSQHKQPTSLQASLEPTTEGYQIEQPYFHEGPLPPVAGSLVREEGTLEYLHRWDELLGDLCRSGFVIEDLIEPVHSKKEAEIGSFAHRSQFIPPYVRIKARRIDVRQGSTRSSLIVES